MLNLLHAEDFESFVSMLASLGPKGYEMACHIELDKFEGDILKTVAELLGWEDESSSDESSSVSSYMMLQSDEE